MAVVKHLALLATPLLMLPLTGATRPAPVRSHGALMGSEFYVTIEGTKQGKLKGESIRDKWKEHIPGIGFSYDVKSPRDLASGQASGKRQHGALSFVKEWGPSSPQLFQAATTSEVLKKACSSS
ncbi:MAG: hypothetical protein PVSMB1_05710 [Gemmatimonadaceae bacterium]